jgi:hypothetical protein
VESADLVLGRRSGRSDVQPRESYWVLSDRIGWRGCILSGQARRVRVQVGAPISSHPAWTTDTVKVFLGKDCPLSNESLAGYI